MRSKIMATPPDLGPRVIRFRAPSSFGSRDMYQDHMHLLSEQGDTDCDGLHLPVHRQTLFSVNGRTVGLWMEPPYIRFAVLPPGFYPQTEGWLCQVPPSREPSLLPQVGLAYSVGCICPKSQCPELHHMLKELMPGQFREQNRLPWQHRQYIIDQQVMPGTGYPSEWINLTFEGAELDVWLTILTSGVFDAAEKATAAEDNAVA